MQCEEKQSLLSAYRVSAALFSSATRKLRMCRGITSKPADDDRLKLADEARRECQKARTELEDHIRLHGC